ncbi:MAG: hypothetical protein EXR91_03125 [Gemmatimonadetes bacterium]|nr:hypothetical protein [Gemmatimonadota bacterium]
MKRSRQETPVCTHSSRCYSSIERYVWDGDQILWETRQADAGDTAVPSGGDQTGVAGYVHVGALDRPVAVILNNSLVVLHRNWRGLVVDATNDAGARVGSGVPWPGVSWNSRMGDPDPRNLHTWYGSLTFDMTDATGLAYKRNRYYDPAAGQFTQQDPIVVVRPAPTTAFTACRSIILSILLRLPAERRES